MHITTTTIIMLITSCSLQLTLSSLRVLVLTNYNSSILRDDRINFEEAPVSIIIIRKRYYNILLQIRIRILKKFRHQQRPTSSILMHLAANTVSPQHSVFEKLQQLQHTEG
jgi:hypothetical protein